jgi:hypothetical protein
VLVALLNQFNLAQQQMFDQFQENMLATARMFAALQQDQMGLVRKELDELRALTGELRSLQAQLSGQAATANPAPTPQPGANGAPHKPPADPVAGAANGKTGDHPPAAAAAPPPAKSPEEVHDWLTQRIAALQEERKGRWHKLLGMIFGS